MDLIAVRTVTNYTYHGEVFSYTDITYTMKLRRRTLYYWANLILPCALIGECVYYSVSIQNFNIFYNDLTIDIMYDIK